MESSSSSFSPTHSVRRTCRKWMDIQQQQGNNNLNNLQRSVSLDFPAIEIFAQEIAQSIINNQSLEVSEWDSDGWHYTGKNYQKQHQHQQHQHELMRMERVALYILSLDAINFCFWPTTTTSNAAAATTTTKSDSPSEKIAMTKKNGLEYEHLAIALRKVAEFDDDIKIEEDGNEEDDCVDTNTTTTSTTSSSSSSSSSIIRSASSYALCPTNLSKLTPEKLQSMLQPYFPKSSSSTTTTSSQNNIIVYELPDIETRCKLLQELGNGLLRDHNGSALHMISKANQSADCLVGIILDTFSGFRDFVYIHNNNNNKVTSGGGEEYNTNNCDWDSLEKSSSSFSSSSSTHRVIHFYKRAQIAVADIWAALGPRGRGGGDDGASSSNSSSFTTTTNGNNLLHQCCHFTDIHLLTTFPDYRVPQILRHVGAICYTESLADKVDNYIELSKNSMEEISIRAATVVAVERLVERVKVHLHKKNNNSSIVSEEGKVVDGTTTTTTTTTSTLSSSERQRADENNGTNLNIEKLSDDVSAVTLDWYLWQKGEKLDRLDLLGPHHRVRTTFY